MIIQKITKKDSLDIWQWRNDKKSIFFSKNKKKVTLDVHKRKQLLMELLSSEMNENLVL